MVKSAPAESASTILPDNVIPSSPASPVAPIVSALPIPSVPIVIVSVADAVPADLLALRVTASDEVPTIPLIVMAPPPELIVRSDASASSIVPVANVIAGPAVVLSPAISCPTPVIVTAAPAVKSITVPVSVAVIVTVSVSLVT